MTNRNFLQYHELIDNIRAAIDQLAETERRIDAEQPSERNFRLIRGDLAADLARGDMKLRKNVRHLYELVFPQHDFENVPEVWEGDPREMNKFVDKARANVVEIYEAHNANPTPASKVILDNAVEIRRKWDELKFKTFYGGDESTGETED